LTLTFDAIVRWGTSKAQIDVFYAIKSAASVEKLANAWHARREIHVLMMENAIALMDTFRLVILISWTRVGHAKMSAKLVKIQKIAQNAKI
jgi:hypothetical protein